MRQSVRKYIFGLAQKFGHAENILGPVKEQGIRNVKTRWEILFWVHASKYSLQKNIFEYNIGILQ